MDPSTSCYSHIAFTTYCIAYSTIVHYIILINVRAILHQLQDIEVYKSRILQYQHSFFTTVNSNILLMSVRFIANSQYNQFV